MAALSVMRRATSTPMPGKPSRSAAEAAGRAARSLQMAAGPSTLWLRPTSTSASTSLKSTSAISSASANPSARSWPSATTTRSPAARAYLIAASWETLPPRISTVSTSGRS